MLTTRRQRGVSLVEILIGMVIVVIASLGALTVFAYGLGGISKQSNRRAALERARQRLDQLMAASINQIQPLDGQPYWLICTGTPPDFCTTWALSPVRVTQLVSVDDDLPNQPIETTIQWVNDPSAGTSTLDTLALGVKVWFIPSSSVDNDLNRVFVRTLRTP